jgi:hypothetical protein
MDAPFHPLNWQAGWLLVLAAFLTGAAIGLFFHRDDFLGGYDSFRRRLLRLGHIALAALGMMNVLFSLSPWPAATAWTSSAASLCFVVGGVAMPAVCFLTAWRRPLRHLFALPVSALVLAAVFTCIGGLS